MASSFDPYHKWLGIPPEEQPANYYRLLAVKCFEDDLDVIEAASDQRMAYLRTFQLNEHATLSAALLNEVAAARVRLSDPTKKAIYDEELRRLQGQPAATGRRTPPPLPSLIGKSEAASNAAMRRWTTPGTIIGLIAFGALAVLCLLAWKESDSEVQDQMTAESPQRQAENLPPQPLPVVELEARSTESGKSSTELPDDPPAPDEPPPQANVTRHKAVLAERSDASDQPASARPPTQPTEPTFALDDSPSTPSNTLRPYSNMGRTAPLRQPEPSHRLSGHTGSRTGIFSEPAFRTDYRGTSTPFDGGVSFSIDLPSGEIISHRRFRVNARYIEDLIKDASDGKEEVGVVRVAAGAALGYFAYREGKPDRKSGVEKAVLDGVAIAYHDDRVPMQYATYVDGKRHGLLKTWTPEGQDLFWCQYKNGRREGYCCFFEDEQLTILAKYDNFRLDAVHLVSDHKIVRSFRSAEIASADDVVAEALGRLKTVESKTKLLENEIKQQLRKINLQKREALEEQRQGIAAKLNPQKRKQASARIRQRRAESNRTMQGLKRNSGVH